MQLKRRIAPWLPIFVLSALAVWTVGVQADSGPDHRASQHSTEPSEPTSIKLGTSGGSIDHLDGAFCCGGTLGALLEDAGGTLYVLSNNHVMARVNRGEDGEDIIHPGLIDRGCLGDLDDVVADLTDFVPIDFGNSNLVDAAIAEIRSNLFDETGSQLDIGAVSSTIADPFIGQLVQKDGRTTGHTDGAVAAVDVNINILVPKKCNPGAGSSALFTGQFRIESDTFSAGGDSGSVIFDKLNPPQAVGLLFAGSSSDTWANKMSNVLNAPWTVGPLAMAGGTPEVPATGSISGIVTGDGGALDSATVSVDTGESTTTDADGTYLLSNVPTGTREVTASKTGFDSQSDPNVLVIENQTTSNVAFALTSSPVGSTFVVDCFSHSTSGGKNGDKHLDMTATIVDASGTPVSGASVEATWTKPDGSVSSGVEVTDAAGNVVFSEKNAANGEYMIVVDTVAGLAPDPIGDSYTFTKNGSSVGTTCSGAGSEALTRVPPTPDEVSKAIEVKRRHEHELFLTSREVIGVGVGGRNGEAVIEVYLRSANRGVLSSLPAHLEGNRVLAIPTGDVIAGGWRQRNPDGAPMTCKQ